MSKYNKVYFLHIPKTGGRFLTKSILRPMENTLKDNGIELVKSPEDMRQHAGWPSWIDNQTYIITVFRDPCEFFVSAVCHSEAGKKKMIDEDNWHILKDMGESLTVSKEELFDTLMRWDYLENFQSKNLMIEPEDKSVIQQAMADHSQNKLINESLVYEKLKRINLVIRHKDLRTMDYSLLVKKISQDLEVDVEIDLSDINGDIFKNKASEVLFNSLNEKEKDIISQMFTLDKKIYEDDSLFWQPNRAV
jgi:hypothetical protein